jgi:hypothetical protein
MKPELRAAANSNPPISRVLVLLAITKLVLHLVSNTAFTYGLFSDELYYIACANHLAFGFVDHPPLSILLLFIQMAVAGDSLFAIRILPALAGSLTVFISGLIARELGGRRFAQVLAAVVVLLVPTYLVTDGFFSMNAFDTLFWAVATLLLIRIVKSDSTSLWIVLGVVMGLGVLNKLSILFLAIGILGGLLLTPYRALFKRKSLWLALSIATVISLTYLIWQFVYAWPTLEFMTNAQADMAELSIPMYLVSQIVLLNPLLSLVWLSGLVWLLVMKRGQKYRLLGLIYVTIFVFLSVQKTKPYYLFPYYPVLFAAGAVMWEQISERVGSRMIRPAVTICVVMAGILTLPFGLPILSPSALAQYSSLVGPPVEASPDVDDMPTELPKYFADRFGWEELAAKVSEVYLSLPERERKKAVVFLSNYSQAAAIDYYRKSYPLPPAISGHNAYWFWGPRDATGEVVIHLGGSKEQYEQYYESSTQAAEFTCEYCDHDRKKLSIFVSRGRRSPLDKDWGLMKHFD